VLVGFTSSHAHYSYEKAAHLTGLGTDNLVAVQADERGQMLPHALQAAVAAAVEQGKVSTTLMGAASSKRSEYTCHLTHKR
jgi:glutamate/tyrosine decarboxylase-like PLP-dependent enzyme